LDGILAAEPRSASSFGITINNRFTFQIKVLPTDIARFADQGVPTMIVENSRFQVVRRLVSPPEKVQKETMV
jgi:hypothetical protein